MRNILLVKLAVLVLFIACLVPLDSYAQGRQIPRPSAGLMPDRAAGKMLYGANCAKCHGADLRGTEEGPPLAHRIYAPSHHADIAFQIAAKYGTRQHHWNFGDMAPVKELTPDEVAHIIAYVRDAQRKAGIK